MTNANDDDFTDAEIAQARASLAADKDYERSAFASCAVRQCARAIRAERERDRWHAYCRGTFDAGQMEAKELREQLAAAQKEIAELRVRCEKLQAQLELTDKHMATAVDNIDLQRRLNATVHALENEQLWWDRAHRLDQRELSRGNVKQRLERLDEAIAAAQPQAGANNRCVRCGAPYDETGQCSRRISGPCQGGRGENLAAAQPQAGAPKVRWVKVPTSGKAMEAFGDALLRGQPLPQEHVHDADMPEDCTACRACAQAEHPNATNGWCLDCGCRVDQHTRVEDQIAAYIVSENFRAAYDGHVAGGGKLKVAEFLADKIRTGAYR